jgi:phosphoglycolate phosphatase
MYKAVLFDLDGTLLDTLEDLADSVNSVLSRVGLPTHPLEDYQYFVGDGVEKMARRALPETCREDAVVIKCVAAMCREYSKRWADKTRPYPGIQELLDGLTVRNITMCVLSNKPDPFTKMIVSNLLPRWRFEQVMGAQPSIPKKPDPTAALELAERLAIPPAEFLYLGDTNTDMQTACAAGMYPVGALWGFRTADELIANGARVLIKQPIELLNLL